jgi:hypothetical protein
MATLLLLVPCVLLIHGYHPWSDDAAIYISGLRKLMHPALYSGDGTFVLAHTRVSIFSHVLAALASVLHLRLEPLILLAYLLSILLFLYASRRLALRVFRDERVSWISALVAAACFSMPVAGTALFLMDPYLSARSFSTPLSIFAITAALDRRWGLTVFWAVLTLLMHPQMGVYLAGFLVIQILLELGRPRAAIALGILAILACGAVWLMDRHSPVSAAYREAVLSRSYFFPGLWHWYEWIGLAAPVALFAVAAYRSSADSSIRHLSAASVLVGTAACIAAFALVHPQGPYLLARAQLLRNFQVVYTVGVILLGGWIGSTFGRRHAWVPVLAILVAASGMFVSELRMYPGSAHLEWPDAVPVNPWGKALVWIRNSTPPDAVFAVSPDLLSSPAEDLPGFRALAERSVLVDNKDEGVASIFPNVAPAWQQRSLAANVMGTQSPALIAARLAPWHVSWVLLHHDYSGSLSCPYRNSVVAVCRLEPRTDRPFQPNPVSDPGE